MTDTTLKPCPFCGGEAAIEPWRGKVHGTEKSAVVHCQSLDCGAFIYRGRPTAQMAIDAATTAWNDRI